MSSFTINFSKEGSLVFPQCTCKAWEQLYLCNCPDTTRSNGQGAICFEACSFHRLPPVLQEFYYAHGYRCTPVWLEVKTRLPFPCAKHQRQVTKPGQVLPKPQRLRPRERSIAVAEMGRVQLKHEREEVEARTEQCLRDRRPPVRVRPDDLAKENTCEIQSQLRPLIVDQLALEKVRCENNLHRSPGFESKIVDLGVSFASGHPVDMGAPYSPRHLPQIWNFHIR